MEDVANQLLLLILFDIDSFDIQLSTKEEAVEAELRKGLSSRNTKFSNWIEAFLKASIVVRYATFITFWLSSALCCKACLVSVSHKEFYWSESVIDSSVFGSFVCSVEYFAK